MPERLTLDIEAVVQGGDGLARHEGQVVFVPGALPGEGVEVSVVQRRKGFLRARLEAVPRPSALRRDPDCRHERDDGCGGCGFRHVADEASLSLKASAAHQALERISKRAWPEPRLHGGRLDGVRRRVRFRLGAQGPGAKAGPTLGLLRRGSHEVVPVPDCLAARPAVLAAAARLSEALAAQGFAVASPSATVLVEDTAAGVFLSWEGPCPPSAERALRALVEAGEVAGARGGPAGAGRSFGASWVVAPVDGSGGGPGASPLLARRRPGTFSQANAEANAALRRVVGEHIAAAGARRVVDLYAGSGNLTLELARHADEVVAVELEGEALEGLRETASHNGLNGVRALAADLREGLPEAVRRGAGRWDAIVLDPPRTGAKSLMAELAELGAPWLLYVSCAPACLARDVAAVGERYEVSALHAFDMFPRTPHLELLAALRRRT